MFDNRFNIRFDEEGANPLLNNFDYEDVDNEDGNNDDHFEEDILFQGWYLSHILIFFGQPVCRFAFFFYVQLDLIYEYNCYFHFTDKGNVHETEESEASKLEFNQFVSISIG